jgi:hypothetical protein
VIAAAEVEAALKAARERDLNLEGIEMFLGLEDLRDGTVAEEQGKEFAELLAGYLAGLGTIAGEPEVDRLAQALELLAANHFEIPVHNHLRVVNYHNCTSAKAGTYERQLDWLAERWDPVAEDELLDLLDGKPWVKPRAGVVPVLYEGYRNSYDVALPLVEKAGLKAWFVVPTAFVDAPVAEQAAVAERCDIVLCDEVAADGRLAMSWDELRDVVARGHAVICHTAHHRGIADLRTEEDRRRELAGSRARLAEELGRPVHGLAFLWGSALGGNPDVDAAVAEAGYRFVLSNTKLQRLP